MTVPDPLRDDPSDNEVLARLALRAARTAGELLVARAQRPPEGVTTKSSSTDMVSDADRAAEDVILAILAAERPDDGVIGEETGVHPSSGPSHSRSIQWVVDPLDGTTNWLYGMSPWCVSIAAEDADGPCAAAIVAPALGEEFVAWRGGGAWVSSGTTGSDHAMRRCRTSTCSEVSNALVATGFGYDPVDRRAQGSFVATMLPRVRDIRRCGSAALDLAWLATGRVDAYVEAPINHWDVAAGTLLVREAGGVVEPFGPLHDDGAQGVLAATASVVAEFRATAAACVM